MFHFYIIHAYMDARKGRDMPPSLAVTLMIAQLVSIDDCFQNYYHCISMLFFFIFSLPTCLMCSSVLGYVWLYWLENPSPDLVPNYSLGVLIVLISVFIETIAEPVYVFSRIYHFVKLKVTNFILICFFVPLFFLNYL